MIKIQENIHYPIKIKISYENKIYETTVYSTINISQLRQKIFAKLNLDDSYILSYKNKIISKKDSYDLSFLFENDPNPLLFINDKNTILPSIKPNSSITITTNIPQQKILNILNLFFQSKYLPFNASIKSIAKGVYAIKFSKSSLANEFLNYFNKKMYKKIYINRNKSLTLEVSNSTDLNKIPKIRIGQDNKNILPLIRTNKSTINVVMQ